MDEVKRTDQRSQTVCLALGIYHEARGENNQGKLAVGLAILNRIRENGKTICETLWEGHGSQFPWVRQPTAALYPKEVAAWSGIQLMALRLLYQPPADITHGATMFYNPRLCGCRLPGFITAVFHDQIFLRPLKASPS